MEKIMEHNVFEEIAKEIDYQNTKWGTEIDDTINRPTDWVAYISHYASRWFPGGFPPYDVETIDLFRKQMIKTAAIAISAIESLDRQKGSGKPFYQKD